MKEIVAMSRLPKYLVVLALALFLGGCGAAAEAVHVEPYHATTPLAKHFANPTPISSPTIHFKSIPTPMNLTNPVRLVIPSLQINALIENVGLQSNSELSTPRQSPWEDVGWYNLGPRPGQEGSAVIDGHLDRPGGYPAVFWSLRNIQVGEQVMSVDSQGMVLHFHVTRVAFYPPQQAPIQEIFGDQNGVFLNLLTCAGDWIPSEHQTTLRLVVYTALD